MIPYVDGTRETKLLGSGMRHRTSNALVSMVKLGNGLYRLNWDHASPRSVGLFRLNESVNPEPRPNVATGSNVPVATLPIVDNGSGLDRLKTPCARLIGSGIDYPI